MNLDGSTQIFGIFGHPVTHSLSPAIHNAAFRAIQYNGIYVPFPVLPENLETAILSLRALQISGINLTVPHKTAVLPYLDEIEPIAMQIGAVNTVTNLNGKLTGYNTDAQGFINDLKIHIDTPFSELPTVILGAGGAAKAIAFGLLQAGVPKITLINRSLDPALALKEALEETDRDVKIEIEISHAHTAYKEARLIINASSVGLSSPNQSPVTDMDWVTPFHYVVDIVYNPINTRFLNEASAKGACTINGLGMLAEQAAIAFELFTQTKAPIDVIRKTAYELAHHAL